MEYEKKGCTEGDAAGETILMQPAPGIFHAQEQGACRDRGVWRVSQAAQREPDKAGT
ncbi:hypothetical protein GmRootV116_31550 [Variovorax sp. V116]